MKTKSKIAKQLKKKTSKDLVKTIVDSKKNKGWLRISEILSSPSKKRIVANLGEIDGEAKDGEIIVVPGKVLSQGEISKKIKIVALGFSENAKEKLSKEGIKFTNIADEIKKNPEGKGIKIIK
ncbi:MAG: 50S ribosomal protein L18e [archaeon]